MIGKVLATKKLKKKIKWVEPEPSEIGKVYKDHEAKGIELVDITQLCEFKLGNSGWCNNFNESEQNIYHIQVWYRREQIAALTGNHAYAIDDDRYYLWVSKEYKDESNFVVFKKCYGKPKKKKLKRKN